MAFTVEDGTIVSGANSYASVSYADDYHTDRGNSGWTGADAVKEAALIKATDYIEQTYSRRFTGLRYDEDQDLSWPRENDYVDSNVIPSELKQATALLALEALSNDLNPALARGGAVKREKVDVLEVEYMDSARGGTKRPAVDGLLSRYLTSSGLNASVTRA